jgi:arabinan endo-1,5-alpha-L-arabinosidase
MIKSFGSIPQRAATAPPRRRGVHPLVVGLALSVATGFACTATGGGDEGDGGGASGASGSGLGGVAPSGGAGASAGAPVGGASGVSGTGMGGAAAGGTGGSGAEVTGGASVGGVGGIGGAGALGGTDASGAGTGALGGGGSSGGAGPGGTSAGGMGGDRCDVAVYDAADPPAILSVSGSTITHDPVVMEAGGRFYLFHTGNNVGAKTSTDLTTWANAASALPSVPAWTNDYTERDGDLWAPDISFFGGQYHLYYSASSFGVNRSCIGHATRAALDSGSWTDHGEVICSNVGSNDNFNAIDPNVAIDESGAPYLAFGSFWSGIKVIPLDMTGARMGTAAPLAIANRPSAGGALEAPFIVRRCGYYYLFVSWDRCCQGADSTYNIRVGRSTTITGPYADKAGTAMAEGGGTLLVEGDARWKGPGHNAVIFRGTSAFNVYHSYDANQAGRITLRISEIAWDAQGWPISAGP